MPRRRYNKKRKARPGRRRHANPRSQLYNLNTVSGLPRTRKAYLRYSTDVTNSSSTGVQAYKTFRCGSVNDPDQTGTGHQPMGYDTWTSLYNHYVVLGAKISVQTIADGTADSMTGVYITDSTGAPAYSDWTGFIEARKGTTKMIASSQVRPVRTYGKYSAKKFFNVKDVRDNLDRLGAAVTANPGEEAYFTVWFQALGGATLSATHLVTIDYIVEFSEPKDLAQS